jgi:hypothetical protein
MPSDEVALLDQQLAKVERSLAEFRALQARALAAGLSPSEIAAETRPVRQQSVRVQHAFAAWDKRHALSRAASPHRRASVARQRPRERRARRVARTSGSRGDPSPADPDLAPERKAAA